MAKISEQLLASEGGGGGQGAKWVLEQLLGTLRDDEET